MRENRYDMIQLITYTGKEERNTNIYVVSKLSGPRSLDDFCVNIIDLSDKDIWINEGSNPKRCNSDQDLISLCVMINNSVQTKIVILLPQDCYYRYNFIGDGKYLEKCRIKDMLDDLMVIVSNVFAGIEGLDIHYENTITTISGVPINAAFCFDCKNETGRSYSDKSKKITTVDLDGVFLSTLAIDSEKKSNVFLEHLGLYELKSEAPGWFSDLEMFDDFKQKTIISENEAKIDRCNAEIEKSNQILRNNNIFKSILYTSGKDLVSVVFEILQDMIGCDLSTFVDEKREDFCFTLNNKVYIGEIKGVNHNVKNENISQLDVHVQGYLDEHTDVAEDRIVALLIMNYQKNKKPSERDSINDKQIKLAERNGCLIISSVDLLKLYEKYKNGGVSRAEVLRLFDKKGMLSLK